MLAFIVCVIGMDTPEIEYLNIAIKMMDFKYSLGMIGKLCVFLSILIIPPPPYFMNYL